MNEKDKNGKQQASKEKIYQSPTLTLIGKLAEETQGGNGIKNDGNFDASTGFGRIF